MIFIDNRLDRIVRSYYRLDWLSISMPNFTSIGLATLLQTDKKICKCFNMDVYIKQYC